MVFRKRPKYDGIFSIYYHMLVEVFEGASGEKGGSFSLFKVYWIFDKPDYAYPTELLVKGAYFMYITLTYKNVKCGYYSLFAHQWRDKEVPAYSKMGLANE